MDDYRIKLQAVFERVIHDSNNFIAKNDLKGFLRAVWTAIGVEFPNVKELLEKSATPGFRSAKEQEELYNFSTVKEALDKILIIMFDAVTINTPAGYEVMKEKIAAMVHKEK